MLKLIIESEELFDEETEEFTRTTLGVIEMEHSLVSLSKWEAKYERSFLATTDKSDDETLDYLKMMVVGPEVPDILWSHLDQSHIAQVVEYIQAKMTATTFKEEKQKASQEIVTAELIYYWMVSMSIPMECQYWHINRLLTLIKVVSLKNQPAKKMSKAEQAAEMRRLNAQRRAQYKTSG